MAIILKDGDGTIHRFAKQPDGTFLAPAGVFISLVEQPDGTYQATRSDDIVYTFNSNLLLSSFTEPNGNQLLFTYDLRGRLETVTHSLYNGDEIAESDKQYIRFEYGIEDHNRDKVVSAHNVFGQADDQLYEQVYAYEYYDDITSDDYGMLKSVRTTVERPLKVLNVAEDGTESISDEVENVTYQERYAYEFTIDSEGKKHLVKMTIQTPSNVSTSTTAMRETIMEFDLAQRVTKVVDANGDTNTIQYNIVGETTDVPGLTYTDITSTVNDQNVGTISYETDNTSGVIKTIKGMDGKKYYFENYTPTLKAQTIQTFRDEGQTAPVTYTISYDSLGNPLTITDPEGNITTNTYVDGKNWLSDKKVSRNGTLLTHEVYTYDEKGNMLTSSVAVSDPNIANRTTTYEYDEMGLLTKKHEWNGQTTQYTYDVNKRLQSSKIVGSGIEQETRYTYDAFNNPQKVIMERGATDIVTTHQYDALGYLLKTVSPIGAVTSYRYNPNGLMTEQLVMGYTNGKFVEAQKTTVAYDEVNRAVNTVMPDGTVQDISYTAGNGEIKTVATQTGSDGVTRQAIQRVATDSSYQIESNGQLGTKSSYDYMGNMVRVDQLFLDGQSMREERGANADFDIMGRVTHVWDDTFTTESYTDYDTRGNVYREWTYVKTEDEVRKYAVKEYTHDLLGRATSVKEYTNLLQRGDIATTEPFQQTQYTYDEIENGFTKNTVKDAENGITETYYNQLGLLVKEVQKGRNSTQHLVKIYVYDAYGRQTEVKQGDHNSQSTKQSFQYDTVDRVKKQVTDAATYTDFVYDHFGRRVEMNDCTDNTTVKTGWAYDKRNQVLFLMQDSKIMGYTYNSAGEITSMRYGAGNTLDIAGAARTVLYDYDDCGRLTAVKSGTIDTTDGNLSTSDIKTVKTYEYAPNGDLANSNEYLEFDTKADMQGIMLTQEFGYDSIGRVTQVQYKQGDVVKEKYVQNYDGRNYILQSQYTDAYDGTSETLEDTYSYDTIGRLTENVLKQTNGEKQKKTTFMYDKVGNRMYMTVEDGKQTVSTKYTYNALGQLTSVQKGLGQHENVSNWLSESQYTYDQNGNQIGQEVFLINDAYTETEKAGDIRYTYDNANQLVKTERKTVKDTEWKEQNRSVYNGEGMRIRQYEEGKDWYKQYFYVSGVLAIATDGSDENFVLSENIMTPDGQTIASRKESKDGEAIEGDHYWLYHYDARGSVTNIVGAKDGSLYRAEENIYDPFGKEETEISKGKSSVVNDIKFTGATLDNSGLYYLGSRHYDPNTGRFLQQDTFKGDIYSPWTQNLYTYTSNNPTNYTDPTGHFIFTLIGGVVGFIWGGIQSVATGGDFLSGAIRGGVSGMGVGIAADLGGFSLPGMFLIGFGWSYVGEFAGQTYEMYKGYRSEYDGGALLKQAYIGGVMEVVWGGTANGLKSGFGDDQWAKDAMDTLLATQTPILDVVSDTLIDMYLPDIQTGKQKHYQINTKNTKVQVNPETNKVEVVVTQDTPIVTGNGAYVTVGMVTPRHAQYRHPSMWFDYAHNNPWRWC